MTGKKTGGKKKTGLKVVNAILLTLVCIVTVALAGLGWVLFQQNQVIQAKKDKLAALEAKREAELRANPPPTTLVNDSVDETVKFAAKHGWVPCPGDCLKLATHGWHHQHHDGYAPTDVWMTFRYSGGYTDFSQRHIGHIIQTRETTADDLGACPICHGTGWVRNSDE